MKHLLFSAVLFVIAGCGASLPTADMGTRVGPEKMDIFLGKPLRYTGYRGFLSGEMSFLKNGAMTFKTDSGIDEAGTWRLKNNSLCVRLVVLRGGREECFTVNVLPDGRFVTSHGFLVQVIE